MTSFLNIYPTWEPIKRIKGLSLILVVGFLALFFFAAVNSFLYYLLFGVVGLVCAFWFARDARVRFASTIGIVIILQIEPPETEITLLGYLAAAIFIGGFLIVLSKKFLEHKSFTNTSLFIPFSLFLLWTMCIGLIGMSNGTVGFVQWSKEFLLWSPLFLLPVYYSEIVHKQNTTEKFLAWCLLLLWAIVFIASFLTIRQNIVQAVYLFEVGVARYDTVNGAFMMYVFLSLAMTVAIKRRWMLVLGFFISAASLLLTFGRTAWVAGVLFIPIVLFLGDRSERKRGYRFLLSYFLVGGIILLLGYLFIPIVHIGIGFVTSKLFSATHLKTDASMYNRYVEWEHILRYIYASPITGYGFGASFKDYDWLMGVTKQTAYTHNAYLSILFKSGLVGFILLFIPYIGFFVKGLHYVRSQLLTAKERAYLRVGITTILYITIIGYTGNVFFQREMMLYIAFYWCYWIQIEYKINIRNKVQ